jgi:hypothetical protein
VGHDEHDTALEQAERGREDEEAEAGRDPRDREGGEQNGRPDGRGPEPPALERERRRRADRQREQHGAAGDHEAVERRALELRIGQRVRVPPEREAGGRKGQDRGRVE